MNKALNDWLYAHRDEMLDTLAALVRYPSVVSDPVGRYPYGQAVAACLDETLRIAADFGFRTRLYDYHAATVEMGPDPVKLGILGHLDVVPAGDGWTNDPFTLTVRNGKAFGRGAIDDKGPVVAVLYAMRGICELGLPLSHGVRLILGCCEEVGGPDMEEYQKHEAFPPLLFTPDGDFPVINVEKGRLPTHLTAPFAPANECGVLSVSAGTVINAVPGVATATLRGILEETVAAAVAEAALSDVSFETAKNGDVTILTCHGLAAHGSLPHKGRNALTALLTVLALLPGDHEQLRALSQLYPYGDSAGEHLGVSCQDEVSGALTMVLSMLTADHTGCRAAVDCRFPVCANGKDLTDSLTAAAAAVGWSATTEAVEPHHVSAEGELVKTLLSVYEEHTGMKGECLAIGGGTYVHDTENGVAFGPEFPGEDNNMHAIDEHFRLESFWRCAEMYGDAICRLCGA